MSIKNPQEKIIVDSEKFFDKYLTFNPHAVARYCPNLHKKVLSNFGDYSNFQDKYESFQDFGSRIWNYNNICLEYLTGEIPKKISDIVEKKYGGKESLKSSIESTFTYSGSLEDLVETEDDLFSFLTVFLNCSLVNLETKNGAKYISEDNPFGISVFPLTDFYYHQEMHKSKSAFEKYCREIRDMIKKSSKPIVVEMCEDLTVKEILNALFRGGVNFYNNFNILAIDPPTSTNLGFCVMNYQNGNFKIVESGTFEIPNYFNREKSVKSIFEFVEKIVSDYWCKVMISESSFGFGVPKIRTLLSENVGIFRLIAEQYSIPFLTISPKHFKSNVLGSAKAGKDETIVWASKYAEKKVDLMREHEADAICIAVSYLIDRELINVPSLT